MDKPVKIDIIAGFLGAGKTTLINKLLDDVYAGEKLALLENEFGEIGIDGDLLRDHQLIVKEITNGCICCTLQGNFVEGIVSLVREHQPERIVIEPTGLGRLQDIMAACNRAAQMAPIRLNALITVVNAVMFPVFQEVGGDFFKQQIIDGKVIVLSCVEQITDEDMPLAEIKERVYALNQTAPIFTEPWSDLDGLALLATAEERSLPEGTLTDHHSADHHHHHGARDFQSLSFSLTTAWTQQKVTDLAASLREGRFGEVFRGKGFFPSAEEYIKMDYVYGQVITTAYDYRGAGKFVVIGKQLREADLAQYLEGIRG